MEHLLRKQNDSSFQLTVRPTGYPNITNFDGSMISVLGVAHNPSSGPVAPSQVTGASLYGPPNTTATYAAARAFALGAVVFEEFDSQFAETLRAAATRAWNWAEANPNVMFQNNVPQQIWVDNGSGSWVQIDNPQYNGSSNLAAGGQEIENDDTGARTENRLRAALYMYEMTGETSYLTIFENNYQALPLYDWWGTMDHYRTGQHLLYFQYMNSPDANDTLVNQLKNGWNKPPNGWFSRGMIQAFNDPAGNYAGALGKHGYRAPLEDYPWGSNRAKSEMGLTFYLWEKYNIDPNNSTNFKAAANDYLHYIHGVNPFNWVYLTNMNSYGASRSLTSIYHEWFAPGSRWSKTTETDPGPAPGYLAGGPNAGFNVQSGFPNSLGGYTPTPHELVLGNHIRNNLVGSPPAKMYMDINDGWPINTWEITEPHGGYQVAYIRLLSKFAQPKQPEENKFGIEIDIVENQIEIRNHTDKPVSTRGLFLYYSDDENSDEISDEDFFWQIPPIIIREGKSIRFGVLKRTQVDNTVLLERLQLIDANGNVVSQIAKK
jgi:hypothetical protein